MIISTRDPITSKITELAEVKVKMLVERVPHNPLQMRVLAAAVSAGTIIHKVPHSAKITSPSTFPKVLLMSKN